MNTLTLVGRLGKDPEVTESKNGVKIAKFSIATNDGYGENKKTNWHNCTAFNKAAEIIGDYVNKGDNLAVNGTVDYNKYEDKVYTNVIVNQFTLLGSKNTEKDPF